MTGVKINNYGSGNNNIDNLMVSTDTQRRGYHAASLTEWTNTTNIPKIAKGSVIEIGGSVIEFQADETITGSIATGDNYISINPSTYVATWTASTPVWNDEYQGFYSGTNRIMNFRVNKNGSVYTKYEIIGKTQVAINYQNIISSNLIIGNDLTVGNSLSVGNDLTVADQTSSYRFNGLHIYENSFFFPDAATTRDNVWDSIQGLIPADTLIAASIHINNSGYLPRETFGVIYKTGTSIYAVNGNNIVKTLIGQSGSSTTLAYETSVCF